MKVWELIHELSKAPANSPVQIGKGDRYFKVKETHFGDCTIDAFISQYPFTIEMGEEDK